MDSSSSASRTARMSARTSGVSAAGLRMSPSAPSVQVHEHGVDTFGGVAGVGSRSLGGLVVRVGVDLEEAEPVVGHCLCNLTSSL